MRFFSVSTTEGPILPSDFPRGKERERSESCDLEPALVKLAKWEMISFEVVLSWLSFGGAIADHLIFFVIFLPGRVTLERSLRQIAAPAIRAIRLQNVPLLPGAVAQRGAQVSSGSFVILSESSLSVLL